MPFLDDEKESQEKKPSESDPRWLSNDYSCVSARICLPKNHLALILLHYQRGIRATKTEAIRHHSRQLGWGHFTHDI